MARGHCLCRVLCLVLVASTLAVSLDTGEESLVRAFKEDSTAAAEEPDKAAAPTGIPAIVTAANGQLWHDTSWHDGGHHPDTSTYGAPKNRTLPNFSPTIRPQAISMVRAQDISEHRLTLTWAMPKDNGAIIEGYRVTMKEGDGDWLVKAHAHSETELAMVQDHLKANTTYQFKVASLFDHGKQSSPSNATTVQTKAGKPDPPKKPFVTKIGLDSMLLHWLTPEDNGSPITGYRVTMQEDVVRHGGGSFFEKIANTQSTKTSVLIKGLKPGLHVYAFRVNAINKLGIGLHSVSSLNYQTLHPSAPAAPIKVSGVAIDAKTIRVKWTPGADNGDKITGYRIAMQTGGKGPFKVVNRNTGLDKDGIATQNLPQFDVGGGVMKGDLKLNGGKTYIFSVRGINKRGPGKIGLSAPAQPKPDVPAKLKRPPSVGNVGVNSCYLEWDKADARGSPITGYRVLMRTAGTGGFATKIKDTKTADTNLVVTGLTHGGISYTFKVMGINKQGIAKPSKPSTTIQTLYSRKTATAIAVKQAMEDFKQHNKIHTLWKLRMQNERYNKRSATQKRIVKNAEELGTKARTLTSQMRMRLAIQEDLATRKLSMEQKLGRKKVRMQIQMWHGKRKLLVHKYQTLIKEVKRKSATSIAEARSIALKKIEKIKVKASTMCAAKLKAQKKSSDSVLKRTEASAKATQTKLKKQAKADEAAFNTKLKTTKADAKRRVKLIQQQAEAKFTKESSQLKAQIASLIQKQPKKLPIKKALALAKAGDRLKAMQKLRKSLEGTDAKDERGTKRAIARATKRVGAQIQQAKAAAKAASAAHVDFQAAQAKEKSAREAVKRATQALNNAKKQELGSAQVLRGPVVVDLGEDSRMLKMSAFTRKRLLQQLEKAKQHLKTTVARTKLSKARFDRAQQIAAQRKAEAADGTTMIKQLEAKMNSKKAKESSAKSTAAARVVAQTLVSQKKKLAEKKKKAASDVATKTKKVPSDAPVWGEPCQKPPTAEAFERGLPEKTKDFTAEMVRRKKFALAALKGNIRTKAKFLGSCEMVANCRALGGSGSNIDLRNCNKDTMCSAGSVKDDARPCKTCASLFAINRWRKANPRKMVSCEGSDACEPTPPTWKLCSKGDSTRSPTTCPKEGINRDPSPPNKFNPGQDVSLGSALCTSCFDGDALEMVHPETKTGICRAFGPKSGAANLNSMPTCHALNNMLAKPDDPKQVCTKIYRPAVLHRGNQTDGFLAGYNAYAYVTCNVRKMVTCRPGAFSDPKIPAKPASYGSSDMLTQKLRCETEKQVSCANVCRVNTDGQLCLKGNSTACVSKTTWTLPQARKMARSKLLNAPIDLSKYDCDPSRCDAGFCTQVALD